MVERESNRNDEADEDEEGLDFQQLRERLGYVVRAPSRRPRLSTAVFALTAGLGIAIAATMPRTYEVETKLLAQSNLVTAALSNPNRQVPRDADSPTKNVSDMILRHDNLVALVHDLDLVHRFYATRSPVVRLKDKLLGDAKTDDERQRAIVSTLEKKLTVHTDDSTVTIAIDWNDPLLAYELANRIEKNFLEARYDDEVAMISDAVSVLQEHAKEQLDQLDAALDQYQKVLAELGPRASPGRAGAPVFVWRGRPTATGAGAAASVDPLLAAALEEKRHQIRTLEEERQREIETLQQELMQAELTLTARHPTVIALKEKVDSLSQPSPMLAQLKREERQLMAQIAPPAPPPAKDASVSPGGEDERLASNAPAPSPAPAVDVPPTGHWDDNGRARLARSRLEGAIRSYQDIEARIDSANIELQIARTAFKYRYTIVTPAEVPKGPKKPVALLVAASSVMLGALFAVAAALLADRRNGRIFEEWQVRRSLKVEVLGELEMPRRP